MKDLDTTWSHVVSRKLAHIKNQSGMTNNELAERV